LASPKKERRTKHSTYRTRLAAILANCCTLIVVAGISGAVQAQPAGIAPDAQRLLKASTDFLAGQKQFSADRMMMTERAYTSPIWYTP